MRTFTIALAGVLTTALVASAADPAPPNLTPEQIQRRLKDLEEQVDRLNRETRQHEVQIDKQTRSPLAQWKDGFVIASADNRFKLKIGAYTQADGRFFLDDDAELNTDQFLFRRVRLNLEGTLFQYFDFRITPDFAGSNFALFDAYLDVAYFPQAKLRFGKFKPPVGLERLQSATALMFVERGLPTNLVPSRDNGVQLFGDLFDGVLGYQLAVVNGVPDNVNPNTGDLNDDKEFAGRVFGLPFKNTEIGALKGLGVGDNDAWQVAASYVITGEPASHKGVTPFHAVEPLDGKWGWGAWEIAARYGEIEIDSDAFAKKFASNAKSARRAEEFVLGTNWYLNKNVKAVLNYANTTFTDGAKTGDRPDEHVVLTRVQLAF